MIFSRQFGLGSAVYFAALVSAPVQAALVVTPTTDTAALGGALGGSGMTITSVNIQSGKPEQFGTYTGFNEGPVRIGDGLVMSTGFAASVVAPASPADIPDDDNLLDSTPEFTAYATSNIPGFTNAYDVASLKVDFRLDAPTAVAFDFVFGSVEYPNNTQFSDAFFAFVDGTSNQISFVNGKPVHVGTDVGSALTTADVNTAFGSPHAVLRPITTTTAVLAAGNHSLLFEIGDVEDWNIDSAVFLSGLRAVEGDGQGPVVEPPSSGPNAPVPLPAALPLLGTALAALLGMARARKV